MKNTYGKWTGLALDAYGAAVFCAGIGIDMPVQMRLLFCMAGLVVIIAGVFG